MVFLAWDLPDEFWYAVGKQEKLESFIECLTPMEKLTHEKVIKDEDLKPSGLYKNGGSMSERAKAIDESELRVIGIDALNKALGPAEALRFLALFHREPTDYVEVSKKLYENQSVEEIFKRAKEHWRG